MTASRLARTFIGLALAALALPIPAALAQDAPSGADLEGVKSYLVEHVARSKAGTEDVLAHAQASYDLAEASEFDYQVLWDAHGEEVATLLGEARRAWIEDASGNSEEKDRRSGRALATGQEARRILSRARQTGPGRLSARPSSPLAALARSDAGRERRSRDPISSRGMAGSLPPAQHRFHA